MRCAGTELIIHNTTKDEERIRLDAPLEDDSVGDVFKWIELLSNADKSKDIYGPYFKHYDLDTEENETTITIVGEGITFLWSAEDQGIHIFRRRRVREYTQEEENDPCPNPAEYSHWEDTNDVRLANERPIQLEEITAALNAFLAQFEEAKTL